MTKIVSFCKHVITIVPNQVSFSHFGSNKRRKIKSNTKQQQRSNNLRKVKENGDHKKKKDDNNGLLFLPQEKEENDSDTNEGWHIHRVVDYHGWIPWILENQNQKKIQKFVHQTEQKEIVRRIGCNPKTKKTKYGLLSKRELS